MRANLVAVLLIAVLPAACATPPQTAETSPERAVEEAFESYRRALLAQDGAAAADLVTEQTWSLYREQANHALTAERAFLMDSDLVDRVSILLLRHGMTSEQLRTMTGKEIFAHAVDRGWIGEESTAKLRLTNYRINRGIAYADVVGRGGRPSGVTMRFVQQEGGWRVDVLDMLKTSRSAVALAVALSGMTQEEFLYNTLEDGTGRRPGPGIWNPPL